MKKTFALTHYKIKAARLVEAAKKDVRRYLKRERRRELPEGVDFLDFDCKYGDTEEEAKEIHLSEVITCIDDAEVRGLESFYVEIIGKPGHRKKKPKPDEPVAESIDDSIESIESIDESIDESTDDSTDAL